MPTVKLPFAADVYDSIDDVELNDRDVQLYDAYISRQGTMRVRPTAPTPHYNLLLVDAIDSIYYSNVGAAWWIISNNNVRKTTSPAVGASYQTVTFAPGPFDLASAAQKASWTTDGTTLVMCKGRSMWYGALSGTALTQVTGGTPPANVCDVAFIDGYFLACVPNDTKYYFSQSPLGLTTYPNSWPAANYVGASRLGDGNVSIRVMNRLIYIFGTQSLEIHAPDGVNPFSPVSGGFFAVGCASRESIVQADNKLFFVSSDRRFMVVSGTTAEVLKSPYDTLLESYIASDSRGEYLEISGHRFIVWSFTAMNATLSYCLDTGKWSRWGSYNSGTGNYDKWNILSICSYPYYTGAPIAGMYSATISKMSDTANYDTHYVPALTRVYARPDKLTGHIDFGTSAWKRSREMRIKTYNESANDEVTVGVRWQDNNSGTWSAWKSIDPYDPQPKGLVKRILRPGRFRTRQYEILITYNALSTTCKGILLDAEEDIEVLR